MSSFQPGPAQTGPSQAGSSQLPQPGPPRPVVNFKEDQKLNSHRHKIRVTFSNHISFQPTQWCRTINLIPTNNRPQGDWRAQGQWNTGSSGPAQSASLPQYAYNVSIGKGRIRIAEQYQEHSSLSVNEPLKEMSVVRSNNIDSNGDPSNDWTIILAFAGDDRYFKIIQESPSNKKTPTVSGNERNRFFENCFYMGAMMTDSRNVAAEDRYNIPESFLQDPRKIPVILQCRLVRIIIPNYRNLHAGASQDLIVARIDAIFDNKDWGATINNAENFCLAQRRAVTAESEAETAKLESCKRKAGALMAFVIPLPGFANRFGLRFKSIGSGSFDVPEQSVVYIGPQTLNPVTRFFGEYDPSAVSGQKKGHQNCWTGRTFLKNRQVHCSIDNFLTAQHVAALRTLSAAGTPILNFSAHFDVDADEGIIARLNLATATLEKVMLHATNLLQQGVVDDPALKLEYFQSFSNIFLKDHPNVNVVHAPITHNVQELQRIFTDPKYQLQQPAHQAAITTVLRGDRGRSLIRGPPATGKTTTVAKLIIVLLRTAEFSLRENGQHEAIVVGAHTNEAVRVCCARTIGLLQTLFAAPADFVRDRVCLVYNDQMKNYWKVIGKDFDDRIKAITLDSQLNRLSMQNPSRYAIFRKYRQQMETSGMIDFDNDLEKQKYGSQRFELIARLKKTVKVWFATLSTLHLKHEVFGIRGRMGAMPGVDTRVLIIDEASQATDTYVAMALLTVDPDNLVLAGDEKQLSPYSSTVEGKQLWRFSVFERLQKVDNRGVPYANSTLLNMQYRTLSHIYAGTNAHYDNKVSTPQAVDQRQSGAALLESVKKIAYRDQNGKGPIIHLNNHTHVFNVQGAASQVNESSSTFNIPQWVLVRDFIIALATAGVPFSDVMALTPYQAQYDVMCADHSKVNGASLRKIDSAQGDEARVVAFSVAKTNGEGFGFLDNMPRQNVGTSRARDGSFVFIDMLMIQQEPRAQAWRIWHDGLKRRQPPGRTLDLNMIGVVLFRINGQDLNVQTVGSNFTIVLLDPTQPPNPSPKSRPASPDQANTGSPSSTGARAHSRTQSNASATGSPRPGSGSGNQMVASPMARSRSGTTTSMTGRSRANTGTGPLSPTSGRGLLSPPSAGRGTSSPPIAGMQSLSLSPRGQQMPSSTPGHARKASGLSTHSQTAGATDTDAQARLRDLVDACNKLSNEKSKSSAKLTDLTQGKDKEFMANVTKYSNECKKEYQARFQRGEFALLANGIQGLRELGEQVTAELTLYNWYEKRLAAKSMEVEEFKRRHNL